MRIPANSNAWSGANRTRIPEQIERVRRSTAVAPNYMSVFSVLAGRILRRDSPFISIRWAPWTRRSEIASAIVGSPMTSCQCPVGSWDVMRRGSLRVAVLEDFEQVTAFGVGQRCEAEIVDLSRHRHGWTYADIATMPTHRPREGDSPVVEGFSLIRR